MIIIILVCIGFGTSYHLTNAYGMTGNFILLFPVLMEVASVMIVTTILLAMVWYIVWGFIIVVPVAFLLGFGLLDGVFWAGMFSRRVTNAYDSDIEQICGGSMVSVHGSRRYDHFHVILEVGNGEEACL